MSRNPAGRGLDDEVETGPVAIRSGLAESRNLHECDGGIGLRPGVEAESPLGQATGTQAVHHQVGLRCQVENRLSACRLRKVEDRAPLVRIQIVKESRGVGVGNVVGKRSPSRAEDRRRVVRS